MNKELKEMIDTALNENVTLSKDEYKEKVLKADEATAGHGMTNKAPVSESVRARRIQSNFYGIAINFLSSILAEISTQTEMINLNNQMLYKLLKERDINVDDLIKQ